MNETMKEPNWTYGNLAENDSVWWIVDPFGQEHENIIGTEEEVLAYINEYEFKS